MGISGSQPAPLKALFGSARFGATRFGYTDARVYVSIGGVHYANGRASASTKILQDELTVTDIIDESPNTLTGAAVGFVPAAGSDIVVTIGSKNNRDRKFAGTILSGDQSYLADNPANGVVYIRAIDYTWLLNNVKVTAPYRNVSASTIAQALIASFGPGFTANHVESNLPAVDEISFTNIDLATALTNLAKRVGAYWYVDYYKDLHFFSTDTSLVAPVSITATHKSLREVTVNRDLSQIVTRVYVEGGGVNTISAVAAGETILPIEGDIGWYSSLGGLVRVNQQRISYTGVQPNTGGSLVGPGAYPSAAPTLAAAAGAGVEDGVHLYAVTFVTAAGESLPGPTASITVSGVAAPASAPVASQDSNGGIGTTNWAPGDSVEWAVTYVTALGETTASALSNTLTGVQNPNFGAGVSYTADVTSIPVPSDTRVTSKKLYRRKNGSYASPSGFHKSLANAVTNAIGFDSSTTGDGNAPPGSNTAGGNQVSLTAIPIGGSTVTSRKIYRTVAGGSQLKLLATIADNTTTTYTDSTADASLGANVPTTDASGLTQPSGQLLAGSTTLLVAGTTAFPSSGGWAVIGNGEQVIRYTGKSASSLSGIPASGLGAITASISYNSTVTPAAALTGIPASGAGAILYPILQGDAVNVLAKVDNTSAQTALAALVGGDGVREEYLTDNRLSETECRARGTALLSLRSAVQVTVKYVSRDPNTRSGATVHIDLPAPFSLSGDFKIQEARLRDFTDLRYPMFDVVASSSRFSFEDLIRRSRAL